MILSDLSYILHGRPYRETSQIVSLFTRENGRVSVIHRGAKRGRGHTLQPFCLTQTSWIGRSDLKTLKSFDILESGYLSGRHLYIGLYLNELLDRILREGQPVVSVFDRYHHIARNLVRNTDDIEPLLRSFEYALLDEMGYGFALDRESATGELLKVGEYYSFYPQQGLRLCSREGERHGFKGEHLLAMAAMDYADSGVRLTAKKLMRQALAPHLGAKPLKSRELFRGYFPIAEVRE
jgi:DNA repair protein RecO (recombination protein O)